MKTKIGILLLPIASAVALGLPAHAQRLSSSYEITHESFSPGGGSAGSSSYRTRLESGFPGGIATSTNYLARLGGTGQSTDVTSIEVVTMPSRIDEGATFQFSVMARLDDLSLLVLDAGDVQWVVEFEGFINYGNPIQSEAPVAPSVIEDLAGTLSVQFRGVSGEAELEVRNVADDDFGSYGNDGIDDTWQLRHFGEPPNIDAGPAANPDHDSSDNLLEFLGGFDPGDRTDYLEFRVAQLEEGSARLWINKVIPGRTYTVRGGTNLNDLVETISSFNVSAEETGWSGQDPNAATARKFYRLQIENSDGR